MRIRWRGLELPSRVHVDRETRTPTYGKFLAEPFERGFGSTVGNSLRRILLSSLEGAAVTRARVQGVQHEFTTIPGVVEDVTDICLNLKSLVVKNHSASSKTLRIEKNTRGVVTGADVICDDTCAFLFLQIPLLPVVPRQCDDTLNGHDENDDDESGTALAVDGAVVETIRIL